jgi:hypothetical protein
VKFIKLLCNITAPLLITCFWAPAVFATDQDLAAASQNPVADMISLPLKSKFDFGRGSEDAFGYTLEMQPVLPVNLGTYNLINRFIMPVKYQEAAFPGLDDEFGLGDRRIRRSFHHQRWEALSGGLVRL